ncbi:hypothetical protein [Clostridium gasigenes]|uniref:hypothetical protein n=1 Tax=Clostridium gasigenes TaxID=94869 RepID=UPI001C0E88E6|nr:hypothetical protein [Clostridium gasigenes]MBU3103064.1 hypothetical protein [Clostridium gasigenes]
MKKEWFVYAENLNSIGDKIIEAGKYFSIDNESFNSIDNESFNSIEELIAYLNKGITAYKECLNILIKTNVPEIINDEHVKLVNSFESFIRVNEFIYLPNTINSFKELQPFVDECIKLQHLMTLNTRNICEDICLKFGI